MPAPATTRKTKAMKTPSVAGTAPSKKNKTPGDSSVDVPKKKRKRTGGSFKLHIYRLLKEVAPDGGITQRAMSVMNSFVIDIFERVAAESAQLALLNGRSTIGSREIQTAVKLLIPGQLAVHAMSEGRRALENYHSSS